MRCVMKFPVKAGLVGARRAFSAAKDEGGSIISAFYHMDHYGFSTALPSDPTFGEGMITAVASTAFGDGEFSTEEKKWIKGHFLSLHYPEDLVDQSLNDCTNSLTKVVRLMADPRLQKAKKMLIYDCFRVASVDGMNDRQKKAVVKLAGVLDIASDDVKDILDLVEDEHKLKLKRINVLGLKGFTELSDKYR